MFLLYLATFESLAVVANLATYSQFATLVSRGANFHPSRVRLGWERTFVRVIREFEHQYSLHHGGEEGELLVTMERVMWGICGLHEISDIEFK